ncbi:MAG: GNAT family N-acetyltransferase [Actinomycetota bacterium]|nr:GNAT family N-acetyltransferase [Actinomycetota bacterium]
MSSTIELELRPVRRDDLPVFFAHQLDPVANHVAAFVADDPADRGAFDARWERLLSDDTVTSRTVVHDGEVVGHVASYVSDVGREVTYWIDRDHWGKGLATETLRSFLEIITARPLHARTASDNLGSLRVLERCGFEVARVETAYAPGRRAQIDETLLVLR